MRKSTDNSTDAGGGGLDLDGQICKFSFSLVM